MPSEAEAAEALMALGLSEYEARCFTALTQLSEGTAKEISQVAGVPQSRVYDVTEQLHERGLVDIEQSDPKRYFALPVDHALTALRAEYADSLDAAGDHLQALEGRESDEDGVWEIATRDAVDVRTVMHVEHASDEVYLLVAHDDLLGPSLLDALADARDRGVTITVEAASEDTRERVHDRVPEARFAVTDFSTDELSGLDQNPGRLLMVDGETILLSALRDGLVPNDLEESGVWGTAVGHGLVVWLRRLLDARRERLTFATAAD